MSISKTTSRLTREAKKLFSFTTTNTVSSTSSLRSSTSSPYSSSSSESMMEENIKNAHVIIQKWEIKGHFISIFHQDKTEEATNFVNCVKGLHRAMRFMASHDSISEKLTLAQGLMQIAMKRLEREFRLILLHIGEYLQPESLFISSVSSIDSEDEQLSSLREKLTLAQGLMQIAMKRLETEFRLILLHIGEYLQPESLFISSISSIDSEDEQLSSLRLIAETMISCGYGVECINVYKIIRKSTIDEALFHLGIQRYTSSHIKKLMNTPCFDNHIKTWLNAVQIAVKTLFLEEKFLCDHVFASYQAVKDSCFQNSTNEAALSLFKFPEVIANTCCKRMDSQSSLINLEYLFNLQHLASEQL
nr:hypothetical protein [Tanacetum cinerariifolium]